MWTGHWTPSFILKTLTPQVPLSLLFLAAALPDLIAFSLATIGKLEYATLAPHFPGTFKYITDMPLTHSLMGNLTLAMMIGGAYYMHSKSQLGATSVFLACLSHFPLEILEHRKDLRIFPSDKPSIGYGLFDSMLFTFIFEGIVILFGYYYYLSKSAPTMADKSSADFFTKVLGWALAVQHTLFSFFLVPTSNARFVHAPMFVLQILLTSGLAHMVDMLRIYPTSSFWNKAQMLKNNVHTEKYVKTGRATR